MKRIFVLMFCLMPLLSYGEDYKEEMFEYALQPCIRAMAASLMIGIFLKRSNYIEKGPTGALDR